MNESIIRADRRGRLRYTAEQKQTIIEAYEASGLSGPKFAELHGVCYQTLVYWLKKRQSAIAGHPALMSLVVTELDHGQDRGAAIHPMEILLADGTRLAVHSPGQVDLAVRLIRELQSTRPC
jgi:hypothetical protein